MAKNKGIGGMIDDLLGDDGRVKGGQASASKQNMSELGRKGGKAAQKKGTAHELTDEERSRGGQA